MSTSSTKAYSKTQLLAGVPDFSLPEYRDRVQLVCASKGITRDAAIQDLTNAFLLMQPFLGTPIQGTPQSSTQSLGSWETDIVSVPDSPVSPIVASNATTTPSTTIAQIPPPPQEVEEAAKESAENVTIRTVFNVAQGVLPYTGEPFREMKDIFADIVEFARSGTMIF